MRFFLVLLGIVVLASFFSTMVLAQKGKDLPKAEKLKDWREGEELAKKFEKVRWKKDFSKNPMEFVKKYQDFDEQFQKYWKRFTERYGESRREINRCFEGVEQPLDVDQDVMSFYNTLLSAINHRKSVKGWCSQIGDEKYRVWKRRHEKASWDKVELYLDRIETALAAFKAGKLMAEDKSSWEEKIELAKRRSRSKEPCLKRI